MLSCKKTRVIAAIVLLVVSAAIAACGAGSSYLGGYTRFVYRTETAGSRVEISTTEISPQDDGQFLVSTKTEDVVARNDIHLTLFGDAARSLGLYMSDSEDSPFDLSPLGVLAEQDLETDHTYLLSDGWVLRTEGSVTVAGLAGVEAQLTHADQPGWLVRVVLAEDLYIRLFLPFPLLVEVLSIGETDTTAEGFQPVFAGSVELIAYEHSEQGTEES